MHWQAVLFDLDGTLVETAPEIADAVNDTLSALGHPQVAEDLAARWIGHGTRELLIQALAHVRNLSLDAVRQKGHRTQPGQTEDHRQQQQPQLASACIAPQVAPGLPSPVHRCAACARIPAPASTTPRLDLRTRPT